MAFNKFKKDKKFRRNVLIGVVLFLFVANFGGFLDTQSISSTCNRYNSEGNIGSRGQYEGCNAETSCYVGFKSNPEAYGIFDNVLETVSWILEHIGLGGAFAYLNTEMVCYSEVPNDIYILSDTQRNADNICEGKAILVDNQLVGSDVYQCVEPLPGEGNECEFWQEPIADIYYSIFEESELKCSTAAYLVLAFGIFAVLAVI